MQRLEKFRWGILGDNRLVLRLAGLFEGPLTDVLQDSGNCFRNSVEKTWGSEDILRDANARAQHLGPRKTGLENGMRPALPAGAHQI
jgi:hypothetical protein